MGNIQTTILESAKSNSSSGFVPGFSGSGYVSLAVIYTVFAVANWLAPPAVALAGPRLDCSQPQSPFVDHLGTHFLVQGCNDGSLTDLCRFHRPVLVSQQLPSLLILCYLGLRSRCHMDCAGENDSLILPKRMEELASISRATS